MPNTLIKSFSNRWIVLIIKILIISGSYFYLFYRLDEYFHQIDIELFYKKVTSGLYLFVFVFFLMLINWLIEAKKWKELVAVVEKISFFEALKAVFMGITFGIFTPARIGELGGRVFVLCKKNRIKGVFASFLGSISQLFITIFLGFLSVIVLVFLSTKLFDVISISSFMVIVGLVIVFLSIIIFGFVNSKQIINYLCKNSFARKYAKHFDFIRIYSNKQLLRVLLYSLIRYVVFTTQFFLLLQLFGVNISWYLCYLVIGTIYFILAFIPTIAIAEIGIRGSVSVIILGMFSDNSVGIIAAATLLWIINLGLPALAGSVFFYRAKI